jgi:hypothetical protein
MRKEEDTAGVDRRKHGITNGLLSWVRSGFDVYLSLLGQISPPGSLPKMRPKSEEDGPLLLLSLFHGEGPGKGGNSECQ